MFLTQTEWIADERGEVLVDFVGRFESLADDFAAVCAELGTRAPLPHLKPSSRGAYQDYFTDETRGIVGSYYAEDVERFGYTFA